MNDVLQYARAAQIYMMYDRTKGYHNLPAYRVLDLAVIALNYNHV